MSNQPNPVRRFFGGLLMVVGGLLGGLSGLCTLVFLGAMVMDAAQGRSDMLGGVVGWLTSAAMVGGIPILIGLTLFFAGKMLWRAPEPAPIDDTVQGPRP